MSFPGPGRVHRDGHDTEHEAAARVNAAALRAQVLRRFALAGDDGCTDFENTSALGHPFRHSIATRREELTSRGWPIQDSGRRRPTDTGRNAVVWVLAESARATALEETHAHA